LWGKLGGMGATAQGVTAAFGGVEKNREIVNQKKGSGAKP